MEYVDNVAANQGGSGEPVFENTFAGSRKTKNLLTENDLRKLANSFITREIAEQAGLYRVDSITGAEIVGRKATAHNDYAGIVFPYFLPEEMRPREYRLRRDKPDFVEEKGEIKEKGKYMSPPGKANMFYLPPNCRKSWLEDVSIPIVFTEGEKKALALNRAAWHGLSDSAGKPRFIAIGLSGVWNFRGKIGITTTPNGGRQEIKGLIPDFQLADWQKRKVIVLFDANTATNQSVNAARTNLGKELTEKNAVVFLADLPEIEGCNGIDDVLGKIECEQSTDDAVNYCLEILKNAQPFKSEKVSQANQILSLAEDIELFHTTDQTAFASIAVGEHIEIHPVNSKSFRDYLSYQFYQTEGKSPSAQALQDAIYSLSGKARFEGKTQNVHIRFASIDGKIYLDLCNEDWQILEIDAGGSRIIESVNAPVRFRRTKAMLPLPTPNGRGDISKLKKFLNVDEKNYILILAWLVNCFRPDYPFPILLISGEQGTAKSTASKVCRALVDPNIAPFRSAPRDERDLIIAATNAWICAFDNISFVTNSLSDGFCRISTGGALATRTLYTDDEETIFTAKRPIILNGIGDIASRSDLLDRALLIKLQAILKCNRKTEREFWAEFEKERTSIFSALVYAVSFALGNIETTQLDDLPRMADFALWATAAEKGLGLNEGDFIKAYTENREDAHSIVLEDSILAEVLLEFCEAKADDDKYFRPNVLLKDLLAELKEKAGEKRSADKKFPKTSKGLRNSLERINPNLREIGIIIEFHGRTGANAKHGASLSLEYGCNLTSPTSPTSQNPKIKAQADDVRQNNNITDKNGNITDSIKGDVANFQNDVADSLYQANITTNKTNDYKGFDVKNDVSDVDDVDLHTYSSDESAAEYIDTVI